MNLLLRLVAFPVFAFIGQAVWMTSASPFTPLALAIWVPLLSFCWFCVGGLSHELVHFNLPLPKWLQEVFSRILGAGVFIPFNVYREVHMRHHAYLNTPLDWELWPYSDPQTSVGFRRVFVWFDLLCGYVATPLIWGRIWYSSSSTAKPEKRRAMTVEYLAIAVVWGAAIGFCIWLHQTGSFAFGWRHLWFALPFLVAANLNSMRKMIEHVGTCSFDPVHGTRTVIGSSLLTKVVTFLDFDLSVHGPHHRHPKLEHTQLKNRMREIEAARPDEDFPVFSSFAGALRDTVRTLFTNPAVGVNAGCTADLSHLPGIEAGQGPQDGEPALLATGSNSSQQNRD